MSHRFVLFLATKIDESSPKNLFLVTENDESSSGSIFRNKN
jgi:hypothetical protein